MIYGMDDIEGGKFGISGFVPVGDPAREDSSGVGVVLKVDDGWFSLDDSPGAGLGL